ncbi:MAG: peptidase S14 [endosymbiont of Escarpia spicata]|uniref:ATP-dependent Clp protease proteolytic subunit n=1 Tax=endosymbiont of Escarpia spicata TaxID=2200908 RepID=A0A370DN84_9GAMM|nr:MAG: peptidase S14 [endosymbiont of Escarpia spicata]
MKRKKMKTVAKRDWFEVRAAKGAESAEVLIYGDIGDCWWAEESVTAKALIEELKVLDAEEINVHVNSYGGIVSDGLAIHNALRRHKAHIITNIDGVAFSIASLIAMAGDTVCMADNALLMIHAPMTIADGNAEALRKSADDLDKHAEAMANAYVRDGITYDDALALLKDGVDHYYTASEAVEAGLIDEATSAIAIAARHDLSRFTNLPAAAAAFNKHEVKPMPKKIENQAADIKPVDVTDNVADIQAAAQAAELKRITDRNEELDQVFASFKDNDAVMAVYHAAIKDPASTVAQARDQALEVLAADEKPLGKIERIEGGATAVEKFRTGASLALAVRAGIANDADQKGNEFRGHTLLELARASLELDGIRTGSMGKMEMVSAAFTHTSGDFDNLLADVANKSMLLGYEEAEETFQRWTRTVDLSDFRSSKLVGLSTFSDLAEIKDGGEYKHGSFTDRGENIQLATYGRLFGITRQTIINDQLQAFTDVPRKMGRAAIRKVGDIVYNVLTANAAMADTVALFHATHNNLLTGAGINTASVDAMRVAMALQTDGNGDNALNLRMAYLLCPVALEGTANVVANSEFEVGASSKNNTVPNSVRGTFEVISDARLDTASSSVWYGAGNPNMHDTVVVGYLDGQSQPRLEQQAGWSVDGVEFKVAIDAAAKAADHRAMGKNPGA